MNTFKLAPIVAALLAASAQAQITAPSVAASAPDGSTINVQLTPTPPTPPVIAMPPAVEFEINGAALMRERAGQSTLRIRPATTSYDQTLANGSFRIECGPGKMGFFDPIVYPGQPGKSHLHTFFGNNDINASTGTTTLVAPNTPSTCKGGTANRSGYWVPSLIDTRTGFPVTPVRIVVYYKTNTSLFGFGGTPVTTPVPGLRMIAGFPNNSSPTGNGYTVWECIGQAPITRTAGFPTVAECPVGSDLDQQIRFMQCWDGVNLDSPDHKSHMANILPAVNNKQYCPSTHPILIPDIQFNVHYKVTDSGFLAAIRLTSDRYPLSTTGGYSSHGDWWNGWDQSVLEGVVQNCLLKLRDGHGNLLCDGRELW